MVDVHTHFLPGIDDGAESVDESLEMLRTAYAQGIRFVVATPHCHANIDEDIEFFIEARNRAFETLNYAMRNEEGPFPEIIPGAEVALNQYLPSLKQLEKLCIGDTKYILLEPLFENMSEAVSEWVYEIGLRGLKPIIAHVDRYKEDTLERIGILQLDVVFQLNASAFLFLSGTRRIRKYRMQNRILVAGSDMHNMHIRKCELEKAYKRSKILNGSITDDWFENNARMLLGL